MPLHKKAKEKNIKQKDKKRRARMIKSKKAQEEIFGFVLVVVVVTIIGLFFIFVMKPKQEEKKNLQIDNLLYATLSYSVGEKSIKDIVEDCSSGDSVACDNAEKEIKNLIDKAIIVLGKQVKGYELVAEGTAVRVEWGIKTARHEGTEMPVALGMTTTSIKLSFYY